ncbi:MAG: NAD(P)H-hydrate dehydratase [Verrucomicrobiales bacterium]|nr:NAD(P)H-hydrate dehydratase [Verrucomicrobiales bacterium]
MMIVSCQQMRQTEERAFASGTSAKQLMEAAGRRCAESIRDLFPAPGRARLYVGRGNNGGDAFVVGQWLRRWGWRVEACCSVDFPLMTQLAAEQRDIFEKTPNIPAACLNHAPDLLIDGLLGIGAKGPLRGEIKTLAAELNETRKFQDSIVIALDLPSGLDGDTGEINLGAVIADLTFAISHVKTGLLSDAAINSVGRLVLIPVLGIPPAEEGNADAEVVTPHSFKDWLPRRPFDFHKGLAGRVSIVAGSLGYSGAARLCAAGALHGGAGLVTLWVPQSIYAIVAAGVEPEIMVRPYDNLEEVRTVPADVLALGPGWGPQPPPGWKHWVVEDHRPAVIDADALNALSRHSDLLARIGTSGVRVLTPHPGELRRLAPDLADLPRAEAALAFVERHRVTLLYKGARSLIARKCRPLYYNTTGHPGMASGGMGDVLTGVCAALLAQGLFPERAAALGSWLLGRAAESLIMGPRGTESAESLSAGQVAGRLGQAFQDWRRGLL